MNESASSSSRRELFIYYRVRQGHEAAAEAIVRGFQRNLMVRMPALQARWLRKEDAATAPRTWMEIYALDAGLGGGIDESVETAIASAASALAPHVDGTRHIEVFRSSE